MSSKKNLVLTSLFALFVTTIVLVGCTSYRIPDGHAVVSPSVLKTDEQVYTVKDMTVRTGLNSSTTLTGQWHIVSSDFIKDHVSNQEDLIQALQLLRAERKRFNYVLLGSGIGMILLALLIVWKRR